MKESKENTVDHKSHKKTQVFDLNRYRSQKMSSLKKTKQKKMASTGSLEGGEVVSMESYKKKHEKTLQKGFHKDQKITEQKMETAKEDNKIIILDDYRKRKEKHIWKKDIFGKVAINATQVMGMALFLFMLMNVFSGFQKGKVPSAEDWFQAPANKGVVVRGIASNPGRSPDSTSSCINISENDSSNRIIGIDPKNCKIKTF